MREGGREGGRKGGARCTPPSKMSRRVLLGLGRDGSVNFEVLTRIGVCMQACWRGIPIPMIEASMGGKECTPTHRWHHD